MDREPARRAGSEAEPPEDLSPADFKLRHYPTPPALDVSGIAHDRAVEVLDRVGRAQRSLQGTGQAEAYDGEGLLEPLSHRGPRGLSTGITPSSAESPPRTTLTPTTAVAVFCSASLVWFLSALDTPAATCPIASWWILDPLSRCSSSWRSWLRTVRSMKLVKPH